MERRDYGLGRQERRRLINRPDIVFQSPDGRRQFRVAFKGSAVVGGEGEILTHTFKMDSSGRFVINGEFVRYPNTSGNRDRLFGAAAIRGCNQRLTEAGSVS